MNSWSYGDLLKSIYIYQANFKLTGKWPQNEWSHANILSVDENEFLVVKQ